LPTRASEYGRAAQAAALAVFVVTAPCAWAEGAISDAEALAIIDGARPRMLASGLRGPRHARLQAYRHAGRPCPRCSAPIASRPQGDGNRMTYWCPGCQA